MLTINNFTVLESKYGRFVVNRHCAYQAEALVKTGQPHIEVELQKILAIAGTLPEGAVVIDAGANIGLIGAPLALALRRVNGVVLAFEAQRMMFYALCGTAALNDLDNLRAFNQALGAKVGRAKVPHMDYGKSEDFGLVSLVEHDSKTAGEEVPVVTVDGLCVDRLDLLKIDVEGMEIEVLEGAARTIQNHHPWCWVEHWKVGTDAIKRAFAGLEYRLFEMDPLNVLCAPVERLSTSGLSISAKEI